MRREGKGFWCSAMCIFLLDVPLHQKIKGYIQKKNAQGLTSKAFHLLVDISSREIPTRWPRGNATGRGAWRSGLESRVEEMLAKNHSSWCEGKIPTLPLAVWYQSMVPVHCFQIVNLLLLNCPQKKKNLYISHVSCQMSSLQFF